MTITSVCADFPKDDGESDRHVIVFFFFEIGVLVIQADCLLYASAKREPKKTRRDSAVYEVCVMSVSNWPLERVPRLERERNHDQEKEKGNEMRYN
jgi:hypothetical protein